MNAAIGWMARHPVAANLLMIVILVGGISGAMRTKQEVFPEFTLDLVTVTVPYPGASPSEVEQGVLLAIEEAVRGVEGVKRVTSVAQEGLGVVSAELLLEADPDRAEADIETAVDRIGSLPELAEDPEVTLLTPRREVVSLVIAGDVELRTLHELAEEARAALLEHEDLTQVDIQGVPPVEIAIEVPRDALERYGLSLDEVAAVVGQASTELPGGALETVTGDLLVRVADRRFTGDQFRDVVIASTADGGVIRLGDVARIEDTYADTDQASYYEGQRAVRVTAFRVGDETPSEVAAAVRGYAEQLRAELPATYTVAVWDDESEILRERISLLLRNGAMGLALVLLTLTAFLELRLAFWVAVGLVTSFAGAFLVMPMLGISINMVTLFAFIMTLGLVVDDAIVVGENTYAKAQAGLPRMRAAVEGTRDIAMPVTFAVLTTVAAFSPLFFVPGTSGKIFRLMPVVVVAILLFSLIESFFVLPAHLGHGRDRPPGRVRAWFERQQGRVAAALERFVDRIYRPSLVATLSQRWLAIAVAVASLVVAAASVASGWVPFNFFPRIEGDLVVASAELPHGSPVEQTMRVRHTLEASARRAIEGLGGAGLVRGTYTRVGEPREGSIGGEVAEAGGHLVTIEMELVPADEREVSAAEVAAAWSEATPPLPGVDTLVFDAAVGPGAGDPVHVQLSHRDEAVLDEASIWLAEQLATYPDLTDIENSWAAGTPQLDLSLRAEGQTLGLTSTDVASQVRAAFYGAEALRTQRGRDEVRVMVRLPEAERGSEHDLERFLVRTPQGGFVPLSYVAEATRTRAPTEVRREDNRRVVDVTAQLAPGALSPGPALDSIEQDLFPQLRRRFPGLQLGFAGSAREQAETFANLGQSYAIALFVIFALLAVPFRSYAQPLVVMSAIPFGFVGAVGGHVLLGYELSLISLLGVIALSGVVVNDSLVLIDYANRERRLGCSPYDAIVSAGLRRFRPILLTSLTTFLGLAPMILERSVQARFLVPMAISLGFGVLFATVIALLVVPALYMALEDLQALRRRATDALRPGRTEEEPA